MNTGNISQNKTPVSVAAANFLSYFMFKIKCECYNNITLSQKCELQKKFYNSKVSLAYRNKKLIKRRKNG